jgi:DHA1 family tetracycline resistance protein-like MFS transporter
MLYAFLIPYALGGIAGPTVQGVISNEVSEKEQGNLQGAITGLVSLTAIFGQFLFAPVFYYFIRPESAVYFPGAPYVLASLLLLTAFVFALLAMRKMRRIDDPELVRP